MPTYVVTAPDGKEYEVDAPQGASQADVLAYAQANYGNAGKAPAAAPAPAPMPDLELPSKTMEREAANAYAGQDVSKMGALMRGLGGAKTAWDRAALGLKGITPEFLGGGLTDEDKQLLSRGKAFEKEGGTAATVGNIAGNVAITAPMGGAVTQGLRIGSAAMPLTRAALTRGVGEIAGGAAIGALTSPEERGTGAAMGALGQAGGMAVNRVLGGLVRPLVRPEARALQAAGVQPTIGQAIGGAANKTEQVLMSTPIVGGAIRNARNRAVGEFNEAAIRTAAPGVRGMGDEAVLAARDAISDQYQRALGAMPQTFRMEATPIIQTAINAADDPALALSQASRDRVLDYVERNLLQRAEQITPDIAKRIESDLGQAVNRLVTSSTAEDRAVGAALQQVQRGWRESLTGVANMTGAGGALREADAAWRAFLPIDRAAASAAAQSSEQGAGRFTPRALRRSIEALDKSANNRASRAVPTGTTPYDNLNRLSRAGDTVLPNFEPDSGTAARLLQTGAVAGAGASGLPGVMAALGGWAGSQALYSRAGQRALMEGIEPAARALLGRGATADQVIRFAQRNGPQALMSLARSAATNPQALQALSDEVATQE